MPSPSPPVKCLASSLLRTTFPPCCIEFSAVHVAYAVIGTYQLSIIAGGSDAGAGDAVAETQRKHGSLELLHVDGNQIEIIETIETDYGVCDIHFHPTMPSLFCTSNSNTSLTLWRFARSTPTADATAVTPIEQSAIQRLAQVNLEAELSTGWVLEAFAWHPMRSDILAVTCSDGTVFVLRLDLKMLDRLAHVQAQPQEQIGTIKHAYKKVYDHQRFEPWAVIWNMSGTGLFSGADDHVIQYSQVERWIDKSQQPGVGKDDDDDDESDDESSGRMAENIWSAKKLHQAGVTAILPLSDEYIITGSYDEHIRLLTPLTSPVLRVQKNLGGGVWRLKLMSAQPETWQMTKGPVEFSVIASCHLAGVNIVQFSRDVNQCWHVDILAHFAGHQSMNYATDLVPDTDKEERKAIVSTSFYDRLVCLWHFAA